MSDHDHDRRRFLRRCGFWAAAGGLGAIAGVLAVRRQLTCDARTCAGCDLLAACGRDAARAARQEVGHGR